MPISCSRCGFRNPDETRFCGRCAAPLRPGDEATAPSSATLRAAAPGLEPGDEFAGRYRVIEELGRGGMGRVYKVYDREVEDRIALKLLNPEIASDEATIRRFRNELKLARAITHKNVCRMYDLGQYEGTFHITMEYVAGETLKSFIRRSGRLSIAKTVDIASQVCAGLAEAHGLGVVHRDLKPQNIMIDGEGNARIMDFGIARSLQAGGKTETGAVLGTPDYMSPEQVDGEAADPRSDIYALGVILFEMLTGRPPFAGGTPFSVALKHKTEAPPDPGEGQTGIPGGLAHIVRRCLEKDRDKRFQSVEDLLAELGPFAGAEPGIAAPRIPGPTARGTRRAKIRPALAAPAIALAALAGIAAWLLVLHEPEEPASSASGAGRAPGWTNSIAVLPFKDFSPGKDQEGFCDGMTEALIVRLSRFQDLKVTAANSVLRYRNTDKDVGRIGTELGVENVVDGTVQREANRIRVRTQLIAREGGFVLWSNEYDRELTSVFDLQDEISQAVAEALKVRLLSGSAPPSAASRPASLEAYDYCLKGLSYIKSRFVVSFREEDFRKGVEMFDRAVELDPAYSLPYCGRAWAYEYHYQITGDERDARIVRESAETAWRLDPDSALNNALLGYALYEYGHDRERAFDRFRRALAINPNDGDVNFLVGMGYLYHGLYEQAIRYLAKGVELDPYNFWTPYKLAYSYMYSGRYKEAAAYFEKYFELAPVEPLVFPGRYISLQIMMKRYDKAEELVARGEKTAPGAEWVRKHRAALLAVRGDRDAALRSYANSEIYALLGLKDEALAALGKEIRGTTLYPYIFYQDLLHNAFYERLRGDPRFEKLVDREKKLYDEAVAKFGGL